MRAEAEWSGGSHDRNAVKCEQARSVRKRLKNMGLSSNQARFLSLTSRQVDLEHRIQQICQRRLRLTSELENIATSYNNSISNRKMFTPTTAGIEKLSLKGVEKLGYKVIDSQSKDIVRNVGLLDAVTPPILSSTPINTQQEFMDLVNKMNSGDTAALAGNYALNCDLDLSSYGTFNKAVINGVFKGTFDGQGHTISGVTIAAAGNVASDMCVGIFSELSGGSSVIKSLQVEDVHVISSTPNTLAYNHIGTLLGYNGGGTVYNVSVTDSSINVGDNYRIVGGLVGGNAGQIKNSYCTTDVTTGNSCLYVGGFLGDPSSGLISSSYSTGDVSVGDNCSYVAGFRGGYNNAPFTVNNSYSTGDVTAGLNSKFVGGFVSDSSTAGSSVNNCYTTGDVTVGAGSTDVGGFLGINTAGTVGATNYYQNNMSTTAGSAVTDPIAATAGWDKTTVWDFTGESPTLRGTNTKTEIALEEGLRDGTYSLVREANEFTQEPLEIEGEQYEEIDWRTNPEIFDELYKGDDLEAENKYDKTVEEINSQDKKLQLEQTTVEVEFKAISSEKEAVKKILDANAQSSFKYFS